MNRSVFLARLRLLLAIVVGQRVLRAMLRAAWLGLGGYLAWWGIGRIGGTQPAEWILPVGAGLIALGSTAWVLYPLPGTARLAWRLDRAFGYKEQISTALQVIRSDRTHPLADLLVSDAVKVLNRAVRRVLRSGWGLLPDLLSLLVVGVLYGTTLLTSEIPPALIIVEPEPQTLTALGTDPRADQIYPDGIPGLRSSASINQAVVKQYSAEDLEQIRQSLGGMGENLSRQAATHDLGQALQGQDLEKAARAADELAGRVPGMSDQSRSQIADALDASGRQLQQAGVEPLAENLLESAQGVRRNYARDAAESLKQLAQDLRDLSAAQLAQAKAGPGASLGPGGKGITGASEPFERLQGGEAEPFNLAEGTPLLSAGEAPTGAAGTEPGRVDQPGSQDIRFLDLFLTPTHFPWNLRDVVSKYFSR